MALSESAFSELRAAIDVGQGGDLIRQLAEWMMQQLVEAEATDKIGAGRYERTEERVTERNGYRPRVLSTKAGDLALRIPKLREGSFFPSILEPRRRIDQALSAVVMEAYVQGVSTRSVDDLVAALGIDTGISKSQVSLLASFHCWLSFPNRRSITSSSRASLSNTKADSASRNRSRYLCSKLVASRHWASATATRTSVEMSGECPC